MFIQNKILILKKCPKSKEVEVDIPEFEANKHETENF